MVLTEREVELIEGMIEVQRYHASRALTISNSMGKKQYDWDMERVRLLERILEESK